IERHERHRRERYEHNRDDLESVECKFPPFLGKNKSDVFLNWEMKVEQLVKCHGISENLKWLCIGVVVLSDGIERKICVILLARDLYVKLERLYQGSKSVEEYYQEMEICMMKAQIKESQEATLARFFHGLNREIQDIVKLHHYSTLEDLVYQATKVESQLKRYGKEREKERPRGDKNPKKGSEVPQGRKDVVPPLTSISFKSSSIKCFQCLGKGHIVSQCPNRRTMVLRENGEMESKSSQEDISSSSVGESSSEGSYYEGDLSW
ncbi:hypothetical protein CR513_02776, partial [Mucuna pruriens]